MSILEAMTSLERQHANADHTRQFVTVLIGGQLFGLPILEVRDVFMVSQITPVPLAANAIAGLFNLRGRVVTMLSMQALLGLGNRSEQAVTAIGIEWRGEAYGLLVDSVGEVISLSPSSREVNPINLDARLAGLSAGIYRLENRLLIELSFDALFNHQLQKAA